MKERRFGDLIDRLRLAIEVAGVVLIAVVLIFTLLPFARERLEALTGLDTTALVAALVALCVPLLFWAIRDIQRDVQKLAESVARHRTLPILRGVGAIYPHVHNAIIHANREGEPRILRVIGLTLYTAWPNIHSWVESGDLNGWRVEMSSILPQAAMDATHIPNDWGDESAIQGRRIEASISPCLVAGVMLCHAYYRIVPPIHGFSVSDRTLFFSHVTLGESGHVRPPHDFYEVIDRREDETRYLFYRGLFDHWYAAAAGMQPQLES